MLSVLPEVLEPIRSHFGVSHRVHDVFVAHVVLQGSSIVPIVGVCRLHRRRFKLLFPDRLYSEFCRWEPYTE